MTLFHLIPEEFAIIRHKGVYRQCRLYHRENYIYAAWGSGYVRLSRSGTSVPDHVLERVTYKNIKTDEFGRYIYP